MSKKRQKQKLKLVNENSQNHLAFANKNFSQHHLVSFKPKTAPQEQFLRSYYQQVPVIAQVGSAGTGKTAISMYCALSEVMDKSTFYDKIIIIRSSVQTREIGFLPGTEEEKDMAYEAPYIALCDELMNFNSNNYHNLKAKRLLEFMNTSFLRGKTFDNSIVIVDECQSMTYHELSTIMTRVGINSRIVFCGDMRQNDLIKKNDKSGLKQFIDVLDNMSSEYVDTIHYRPEDIVRSDIVKDFLLAEEHTAW